MPMAESLYEQCEPELPNAVDQGRARTGGPRLNDVVSHMDMVRGVVSKSGANFVFSIDTAGRVPDKPVLPSAVKEIWWT